MEENLKSKLGFSVFFVVIIFLLVGGYIYTNYTLKEDKKKIKETNDVINYKIDNDKDFIYFENEEIISEEAEITFKDVIINLNTQDVLNESLSKENKIFKENIKYISDQNILSDQIINYNNDNLYALSFRNFSNYEYDKYISLVINYYNYTCFDSVTYDKSKSYVFNTSNGLLLTEEELLNIYDLNIENVKEKVREYLNSKQSVVDGVELIKIDDTLNDFTYGLYINNYGKLCVSLLVKTTQVDYNENVEVN